MLALWNRLKMRSGLQLLRAIKRARKNDILSSCCFHYGLVFPLAYGVVLSGCTESTSAVGRVWCDLGNYDDSGLHDFKIGHYPKLRIIFCDVAVSPPLQCVDHTPRILILLNRTIVLYLKLQWTIWSLTPSFLNGAILACFLYLLAQPCGTGLLLQFLKTGIRFG